MTRKLPRLVRPSQTSKKTSPITCAPDGCDVTKHCIREYRIYRGQILP